MFTAQLWYNDASGTASTYVMSGSSRTVRKYARRYANADMKIMAGPGPPILRKKDFMRRR